MVSYNPVNLNKKKSDAIVVHCCDPRFQEAYRQAAEQLSDYYDLMAVPGASMAIVDDPNVVDNIKLLHSLHHFEYVHIMDHIECGAFGVIDDEVDAHSKYLHLAIQKLAKELPKVKVIPHLLGAKAELKLKVPA